MKSRWISRLRADARRVSPRCSTAEALVRLLMDPSVRTATLIRLAASKHRLVRIFARNLLISVAGVDVGQGARVGAGLLLPHPVGVVIGEGVRIGRNVTIYQGVTLGRLHQRYPVIGNRSIIYPGCILIGMVRVRPGARVPPASYVRAQE